MNMWKLKKNNKKHKLTGFYLLLLFFLFIEKKDNFNLYFKSY